VFDNISAILGSTCIYGIDHICLFVYKGNKIFQRVSLCGVVSWHLISP